MAASSYFKRKTPGGAAGSLRLRTLQGKVRQVAVKLCDVNAARGGIDNRCGVVVNVAGMEQVVLADRDSSLSALVDRVSGRLDQLIGRGLDVSDLLGTELPLGERYHVNTRRTNQDKVYAQCFPYR